MTTTNDFYMVSACLVGLCTRYDGKISTNRKCLDRLKNCRWIPFCPEQLGGLPTPRQAADIIDGNGYDVLAGRKHVITKSNDNVSREFIKGAEQVLAIARAQNIEGILLKSGSPSCAVTGRTGVTAAILEQHGFPLEEF